LAIFVGFNSFALVYPAIQSLPWNADVPRELRNIFARPKTLNRHLAQFFRVPLDSYLAHLWSLLSTECHAGEFVSILGSVPVMVDAVRGAKLEAAGVLKRLASLEGS